jgi:hypothetical protein
LKSRVEQLAEDVKDEACRDELRPVRAVVDPRQALATIQGELIEEMAGALGRAERRVKEAIAKLATLEPGTDAHETQRQLALRLRRDLSIHREALRFPPDPRFIEEFPISARGRR